LLGEEEERSHLTRFKPDIIAPPFTTSTPFISIPRTSTAKPRELVFNFHGWRTTRLGQQ
jgi:hypothetical protein